MNLTPYELASVVGATVSDATRVCAFLNMASRSGVINTLRRNAMFLAQLTHESAHLSRLEENLSYSTQRLMAVWPTRFRTLADAEPYAHNPQALANKVYNGRMGNVMGSNDGWTFRGRGLIQITGRENYTKAGLEIRLDLVNAPEQAATPQVAVSSAVCFWLIKGCNGYADAGDILSCTHTINGGTEGLADRTELYKSITAKLSAIGPAVYNGV